MIKTNFTIKTTFRSAPITLHFTRQNGNLAYSAFDIRSDDGKHIFSIKHEGSKFVVYNIRSSDTTNAFFYEMEKTIENIKKEILSKINFD